MAVPPLRTVLLQIPRLHAKCRMLKQKRTHEKKNKKTHTFLSITRAKLIRWLLRSLYVRSHKCCCCNSVSSVLLFVLISGAAGKRGAKIPIQFRNELVIYIAHTAGTELFADDPLLYFFALLVPPPPYIHRFHHPHHHPHHRRHHCRRPCSVQHIFDPGQRGRRNTQRRPTVHGYGLRADRIPSVPFGYVYQRPKGYKIL